MGSEVFFGKHGDIRGLIGMCIQRLSFNWICEVDWKWKPKVEVEAEKGWFLDLSRKVKMDAGLEGTFLACDSGKGVMGLHLVGLEEWQRGEEGRGLKILLSGWTVFYTWVKIQTINQSGAFNDKGPSNHVSTQVFNSKMD